MGHTHIRISGRTSVISPPPPLVLNAASVVPGPEAKIEPETAVGFWSHNLGLELLRPGLQGNADDEAGHRQRHDESTTIRCCLHL